MTTDASDKTASGNGAPEKPARRTPDSRLRDAIGRAAARAVAEIQPPAAAEPSASQKPSKKSAKGRKLSTAAKKGKTKKTASRKPKPVRLRGIDLLIPPPGYKPPAKKRRRKNKSQKNKNQTVIPFTDTLPFAAAAETDAVATPVVPAPPSAPQPVRPPAETPAPPQSRQLEISFPDGDAPAPASSAPADFIPAPSNTGTQMTIDFAPEKNSEERSEEKNIEAEETVAEVKTPGDEDYFIGYEGGDPQDITIPAPATQADDGVPAGAVDETASAPAPVTQLSLAGVYTVPPDQPYLDAVAKGILDDIGDDMLTLADVTLLVPDMQVGSRLRQAFLRQLQGKTSILPRIEAPGGASDDELSLQLTGSNVLSQALMDIPPQVTKLERQLILAAEILKIPGMSSSMQKAVKLASELGRLLDVLQRHSIDLADLETVVPEGFEKQWEKTADFLKIITDVWPKRLAEMGRIDPEDRRNALIQIQAANWLQQPPKKPMIAVGFAEASPATISLLQAVSLMEQGSIVLPGLDRDLDARGWDDVSPVNPQYALKQILQGIDADRADVDVWPGAVPPSPHARAVNPARTAAARAALLRAAMNPAGDTPEDTERAEAEMENAAAAFGEKAAGKPANDNRAAKIDPQALSGLDLVTCATPQEEASVIALKMRETLEVAGRTAMLVTADRSLARRVSARLKHWKIDVSDSAARNMAETQVGILLLSSAQMAADRWAPIPLLETLKHPLAGLGLEKSVYAAHVRDIEAMALHGARPAAGAAGLKETLTAAFNRRTRSKSAPLTVAEAEAQTKTLHDTVDLIQEKGADFFRLMSSPTPVPFTDLITAHILFIEDFAATSDTPGRDRLWSGAEGAQAVRFFTRLRAVAATLPDMTGRDYLDVMQGLLKAERAPVKRNSHSALSILTPEQALFEKADTVIIGGLNDGSWPQPPAENPWLSPDMLKALGVPAPEGSIGHAALQFLQLASNSNVLITRAERAANAPTVVSPFLTRMLMVLKGAGLAKQIEGKTKLLDIHTALHTPASVNPISAPEPRPPVSVRPKELPVTAVEALMRDPYAVYAKYILGLNELPPIDASPSVAEKGNFTHEALDAFVRKYPKELPKDAVGALLKMGADAFKTRIDNPSVKSFWWPRFERIAEWFVKYEIARRKVSRTLGTEVRGRLEIDLGAGETFTLTSIADRIDLNSSDKLAIIDYKTGGVPASKDIYLGFSPQLTLEALIASTGGFEKIDARETGSLEYWKLSGARPAGEITVIEGSNIEQLIEFAREGITRLMTTFNQKDTPYYSSPRADWAPRYKKFNHLARTAEWAFVKKQAAQKKAPKPKGNKTPRLKKNGNKGNGKGPAR